MKLITLIKFLLVVTVFCSSFKVQADDVFYQQRAIKIAINKSSFPYHFQNEQGQAAGIMVDFWTLWAQKQNVEVEFVIVDWSATIRQVKENTLDLHAGLSITDERQKFLDFTSVLFFHNSHIFLHRGLDGKNTLSQLAPYTLGVVKDSSHINEIRRLQPNLKLRIYQNRETMFDEALDGEILAFASLNKSFSSYARYDEIAVEFPAYKKINYYQGKYAAAVAKNSKQLLQFVEQGLNKITVAEKQAIEKKWRKFDKADDVLRLVFTPNLPPYMAISPEGNPQGLFIDIWRLWAKQAGQKIEFIAQSMIDAIELIKQNGADVHIAYPISEFSDTELVAFNEIYAVFSQVFISNDLPNITSFAQLNGKNLGVFTTAPYKQEIIEHYPDINIRYFSGFENMLQAAELKEIDAMVGSIENMNAHLIKSNLQSSFYPLASANFKSQISSLISSKNSRLIKVIKQGFSQIPLEDLIELEQAWLSNTENAYFHRLKNRVQLSEQELEWLHLNQPVKIGINPNWSPIEFIDELGEIKGINPAIVNLIAQRTGIEFEYVQFPSWNELFQGMVNKKIDVLASTTRTAERDKFLLFSQPYWDMPTVIMHPQQLGEKLVLKDFYGKSLAVVKGYHLVSSIQKEHPSIVLKLVDNFDEALLAVQRGLADGLIENIATASELISRESLIKLTISVVDGLDDGKNYFAIQQQSPELKSIFDKAIASISDGEKQAIYEEWFGINVETGYNKTVVMRVAVQVGAIILFVIIIIVVWNRRLRGEIESRKELEEKMKHMATHDELTGLANRVLLKDRITTAINFHQRQNLEMAVLFIDLDGFKNINDTYGHDVGDELLIEVANTMQACVRKSDTVVRFGGDEFVLLLTALNNKEEAAFVAEKVLKLMQQPFDLSAVKAQIGCSIGIAMYPDDGVNDIDLVKVADTLMYKVKAAGKNHYVFNQ